MPRLSTQTLNAITRRLREIPKPSRTAPGVHRPRPTLSARFRITAATQDGTNKRWVYAAKKLGRKSGAGYAGTWADDPIDTAEYTLFNGAEKINGAAGTFGNGLNQDDIDAANLGGGNFAVAPIPVGAMPVYAVGEFLDDGTLEWWITNFSNAVVGNCEGV